MGDDALVGLPARTGGLKGVSSCHCRWVYGAGQGEGGEGELGGGVAFDTTKCNHDDDQTGGIARSSCMTVMTLAALAYVHDVGIASEPEVAGVPEGATEASMP